MMHVEGGNIVVNNGAAPAIFTGSGELNHYLQITNSSTTKTPSGLKTGGLLVSDDFAYSSPSKNDLVVKGHVVVGALPESFGNLRYLTYIDLGCAAGECTTPQGYNMANIITDIPATMNNLTSLKTLDLTGNTRLGTSIGTVENFLAKISEIEGLAELDLSNCGLVGPMPQSLASFVNLTFLSLQSNTLNGVILADLNKLDQLQTLDLSGCALSYPISDNFWTMLSLQSLDLSGNNFTGYIPDKIGDLVNLRILDLSGNAFNDQIPTTIGNLQQLSTFRIFNSKVIDDLPAELWTIRTLTYLDIGNNLLAKPVPSGIGNLVNLERLYMSNNAFNSKLPDTFTQLVKLTRFEAQNCRLQGPVPDGFWNMSILEYLDVSVNPLLFRATPDSDAKPFIPTDIRALVNLKYLFMARDSLHGHIPQEIGMLVKLENLELGVNQLDSLPGTIGNLVKLTSLGLAQNKIRTIPSELTKLTSLQSLAFDHNKLSNALPANIGDLFRLNDANFSFNQITGTLPASLGKLSSLRRFDIQSNYIEGAIPEELWSHSYQGQSVITLSNNRLSEDIPTDKVIGIPDLLHVDGNFLTFTNLIKAQALFKRNGKSFTCSPQNYVDETKSITAKVGSTVTLIASVDTNTDPESIFQWFRSSNGQYSNSDQRITEAAYGNTGTSMRMTADLDGVSFYYIIMNDAVPGLILTSRMQTLHAQQPQTVTICVGGYDSTNTTLALFDYDVDWSKEIQKCLDNAAKEDSVLTQMAVNKLVEERVGDYYAAYQTACMNGLNEELRYMYHSKEYHYTLYYYDQAGNLVQTVPPKGVDILNDSSVQKVITKQIVYPAHSLVTRYAYNSLQKVTWLQTPDAGTTQSWYNTKGQLRLSQNAQQHKDNRYAYAKYDRQGRIVESGEMLTSDTVSALLAALEDVDFPLAGSSYALSDVVRTHYDLAANGPWSQANLRNHISYVEVLGVNSADTVTTVYSYDMHGTVRTLYQKLSGLPVKRVDYVYDLMSGKVNYMLYQYGGADQYIHRYDYDSDNRMELILTSYDGFIWDVDATYGYYAHGPLARVELGEYKLQGTDYVYTLQGWTKGVNGLLDPGHDGLSGSITPRDVYSYTLGYHKNDYAGIGLAGQDSFYDLAFQQYVSIFGNTGLYNGNVTWMATEMRKLGQVKGDLREGMQGMIYRYDQLNRLVVSRSLQGYDGHASFAPRTDAPAPYDEDYTYDANGNLLTLLRHGADGQVKDKFDYAYYANTNKLRQLVPVVRNKVYSDGVVVSDQKVYQNITITGASYISSGTEVTLKATENISVSPGFRVEEESKFHAYVLPDDEGMYLYDAIGNLVWDQEQGVKISWTAYGKVSKTVKGDTTSTAFSYDGSGNRIIKKITTPDTTYTIHYIRDASGNVLATYADAIVQDHSLYGSSRLGVRSGVGKAGHRNLGNKRYELSNHLGNVLTVLSDNIYLDMDSTWIKTLKVEDYYPFGLEMEGREYSDATGYRYGFNGKEKDNNGEFGSVAYDYGFRIYNPSIGKFLSVDPLAQSYPELTPYQFASNMPISAIDLDGLEATIVITAKYWESKVREAVNSGKVEDAVVIAVLATLKTLDDLETPAAKKWALGGGGWIDGRPAHYTSLDGNNGLDVKIGDKLILSYRSESPSAKAVAKDPAWYQSIVDLWDNFVNPENQGYGYVYTTRDGYGTIMHVRGGQTDSEDIDITILLKAMNATSGAAGKRPNFDITVEKIQAALANLVNHVKRISDTYGLSKDVSDETQDQLKGEKFLGIDLSEGTLDSCERCGQVGRRLKHVGPIFQVPDRGQLGDKLNDTKETNDNKIK